MSIEMKGMTMVKRKFEVELDVPDNFDEKYTAPKQIWNAINVPGGCDPPLGWLLSSELKPYQPKWRKAEDSDVGRRARFRDSPYEKHKHGRLSLYQKEASARQPRFLGLIEDDPDDDFAQVAWFVECEVLDES
jgi:hypothetical protein